jgi:hypothetical protein
LILPIYTYDHNIGESITGGFVYRGTLVSDIYGKYIFADFEYGDVWSLEFDGDNAPEVSTLGDLGPYSVTSFGVDQHNELYICSFDGKIYKFVQTDSAVDDGDLKPNKFSLYQNYPNPFNPTTTIRYDIAEDSHVIMNIYDVTGRLVETLVESALESGEYEVIWDARDIPSGVYLAQFKFGDRTVTQKLILLK